MTTTYSDLQDRNVLVTGGASGLGYAIAGAFAEQGSNVLIVGRNEERLKTAQQQLGERVTYIVFDLNNIDHLGELVREAVDSMGEIDVLVNNAGVHLKKDALAVSNHKFQQVVLTNQTAVSALTREVGKGMVARRAENIIM
ncbi:SDR family NAD(P)-dependent oxidoreductase, partial [bacterium]